MKITATLSDAFLDGEYDTEFAADWGYLTSQEQAVIAEFMHNIGNGYALRGKNKPSWVYDDYETIPGTSGYEAENYWHYHCGPTWNNAPFKSQTIDLKFNPGGMQSNECIHYAKVSSTEIVIVGYSRNHIPFLKSEDTLNPFFN
ncbi:hypothetical protein ACV822_004638 [Klebsiella aerogenes]|uniref:hypothetical protein n=1 Tax=Klebsiella TaxID=570 RepID=UPI0027FBA1E0|nr:hypothetical protein [Klebsiella aerogenes]EKZ9671676.1 hypothetical protein [Klebsiella aerogenes]MDQ8580693.1 hypothetical protein [Klebsiella aerogenes]HCR0141765.1 hypothetical protein [Klebsiella aerogenes]